MRELKYNPYPHVVTELKRCPFCGGKAKLYRDRPKGVSPCMGKPHVECTECTASVYASSAIQVVEAWNRRIENDEALSTEPQKLIDKLREEYAHAPECVNKIPK